MPRLPARARPPGLALSLVAALSLAGTLSTASARVPDTLASSGAATLFSPGQIRTIGNVLYARVNEPAPRSAVRRYELKVRTQDERGRPLTVRAQLFVPDLPARSTLPVYVLGPGTTGLADACSVFNERPERESWGWYQGHMLSYASQGFIGMMVDYAGFSDGPNPQPYFVAASEARVLLDAARAVTQFFAGPGKALKAQPARSVFFSGYSQGGHSSFAAADLAASYAPDVPVKGVVVFGATTDPATLWRENAAFAPYLVAAYEAYYGKSRFDAKELLLPNVYAGLGANARARCVGDLFEMYGKRPEQVFRPEVVAALRSGTLGQRFPEVARLLKLNSTGLAKGGQDIPAFVAQGTADDIVTSISQRAYVKRLCDLGRSVQYREYRGINHYYTRQVAIQDALAWMRTVSGGKAAPSTC